jgi:neutral ceramidase
LLNTGFSLRGIGLVVAASCLQGAWAGQLKAGAGKASITPTADVFPYVAQGERDFVGVHDDVFARALVLDDGAHRVAIVALEVTAVPDPKQMTTSVAEIVGTPSTNVIVVATHTHEVPLFSYHGGTPSPTQQREIERVRQGALEASREAVSHLQPARVSFARGEAWVNINNGEQAGLKTAFDPKGPSDKTLDVLRVESQSGDPIAMLVNYATHAEVMFRSVTKDSGYEVSGDIPGAVSRMLEGQPYGAPVVLYSSGAEGDQLPLFKSLQQAGLFPAKDEGSAGWALLDVQSRRLASAVAQLTSTMHPGDSDVHLNAESSSVICPGQHLKLDRDTGKATVEDRPPVSIPIGAIRINDIALGAVGGDVATEIGTAIRTASPIPHTMIITMLAGSVGYILPDASYAHPGHGLSGSPLKAGCAEHALSEGMVQLLSARPRQN